MKAPTTLFILAMLFTPQETPELKRRWENFKAEEKAWSDKTKQDEAARKKSLQDLKISEVVALGEHGDSSRCVDIAFIGDGFTREEQAAFNGFIDEMAANFKTPPFDAHKSRLNLYRINLVSEKSGIDLEGSKANPPLGGTVNKFSGGSLLVCDVKKALDHVRTAVPEADYIAVVLNTHEKFVGSANSGQLIMLSTAKPHRGSLVMHEFGHNFGSLLDEYVDEKQSGGQGPPAELDKSINATLQSNVHLAKWHYWNVPDAVFRGAQRGRKFEWEDNVRCYEGAATYPDKVYRAEENCHMQRGMGKEYCRVCRESMERDLRRFFPVIESVHPLASVLKTGPNPSVELQAMAQPIAPELGTWRVAWYLDGRRLPAKHQKTVEAKPREKPETRHTCSLQGSDLKEGIHTVTVVAHIESPRVRMDHGVQTGSFTWTIHVNPAPPDAGLPKPFKSEPGKQVAFTVAPSWKPTWLPTGATFDPEKGAFEWTPDASHLGAHRLEFSSQDAKAVSTQVTVATPDRKNSQGPKFLFLPDPEGKEGKPLEFDINAYDADGDALAFASTGLPPGASLHPSTGKFEWAAGHTQRGLHAVKVTVTDGEKTEECTVRIRIQGSPRCRGLFRLSADPFPGFEAAADWMLVGLRHPHPEIRRPQAARLAEAPKMVVLAESMRLLKDPIPEVAALAEKSLRQIFEEAATQEDPAKAQWHLDLFLDEMPRAVWQLVDRPEALAGVTAWCRKALGTKGLPAARTRDFEGLLKDLAAIEAYNKERREKPPKPPITDKKLK